MSRADAAQVRALIAAYHRPGGSRTVLALDAEPEWSGPPMLDGPGAPARVVTGRSPLAVREALVDHEQRHGELLVLLTTYSGAELGLDVRARLVRGDVLPLDPYASILALFRATVLDPELARERWLIDDLIAIAPSDGWPDRQPLGGVLDAEVAWRTWNDARLGLAVPPVNVAEVMSAGERPGVGVALGELPRERRARVAQRWAGDQTGPVPVMVDLIAAGRGSELASLGLVAQVLWAATDEAGLAQRQGVARARLETVFGRDRLDAAGAAHWGAVATAALDIGSNATAILDAAEAVLAAAGASDIAVVSDSLPQGFEQRLAVLGRALAAGDVDGSVAAMDQVRRHRHASRRIHRVDPADAAVRLLRRSKLTVPAEASMFAGAVAAYAADGSWVDQARRLLTEGDHVTVLSTAYRAMADSAAASQASRSRRFAAMLAEWSASEPLGDARLVPIEQVLDQIVAPIATAAPVLLVVCDGMSLAVAHDLMADLVSDGWAPAAPAARDAWPVGVATLPTVTEVSRTSLLAGRRTVGGQREERDGFASHPGLRAASHPTRPPVLFHKAALVAPSGMALPDEVRRQVADPDQRVVGVVVNSVDDHLARGDQVRVGWDLVSLRPLPWLLDAAGEAGRVVILTSDHGHVLHGPASISRPQPGGGERWRSAPPPAGDDEVDVAGPRVLLGDGHVVLPSTDAARYGGYKHGYHGGATPEEVLVPIEILARRLPEGWMHHPIAAPIWWAPPADRATPPRPIPGPPPVAMASPCGQPSLFDEPAPPTPAPACRVWVDALLAAPAFLAQRQRARLPRPLPDDRIRRYLDAIYANGGTIPLTALAARTGEPADTLRMALTLVQRLLNLDGSEVLAVRSDGEIVLDQALAELQFEIAR